MRSIDRHQGDIGADGLEKETLLFFLKRFKHFYPQYLLSWVILALYCLFDRRMVSISDILLDYPPEILMLQMIGVGKRLNPAMWYVSALLLASTVIYYLANRNRKRFIYLICPLCVLLIYSYFYQNRGALGGIVWNNLLIVRDGFWRALAGLCVGCFVYEIHSCLSAEAKRSYPIFRTIYGAGALCLLAFMFYQPGNTAADFTLIAVMALLVLSVMSSNEREGGYLDRLLCRWKIDGRYAYAIYCNHWVINYMIRDHFPGYPFYPALTVYLIITVIMSIFTTVLIDFIFAMCCSEKNLDRTGGIGLYRLKHYKFLFEELVKRDFKKKYKRTVLGMAWSILSPLLTLLVMRLVFTQFFGRGMDHYTTYLFCGNLVFSYFNESTSQGMTSLMGNAGIFTKVNVPKYLFLFSKNVQTLINFGLTLCVFFLFCVLDQITFTWRFILLLYPICCLALFNIGVGLILSALFVFFRDIQYLWSVFTQLLMYMSAVFYTIDNYSPMVQNLFLLNPVYLFIRYFRKIVMDAVIPTGWFHLLMAADVLIVLGIGCWMYKKYNTRFLYYV